MSDDELEKLDWLPLLPNERMRVNNSTKRSGPNWNFNCSKGSC